MNLPVSGSLGGVVLAGSGVGSGLAGSCVGSGTVAGGGAGASRSAPNVLSKSASAGGGVVGDSNVGGIIQWFGGSLRVILS